MIGIGYFGGGIILGRLNHGEEQVFSMNLRQSGLPQKG